MVSVNWSARAEAQVYQIYEFLASKSKQAARKTALELFEATKNLDKFPRIGAIELDLTTEKHEYRYILVDHRYKIIYLYENNYCDILMVWDCKRNPDDKKIE